LKIRISSTLAVQMLLRNCSDLQRNLMEKSDRYLIQLSEEKTMVYWGLPWNVQSNGNANADSILFSTLITRKVIMKKNFNTIFWKALSYKNMQSKIKVSILKNRCNLDLTFVIQLKLLISLNTLLYTLQLLSKILYQKCILSEIFSYSGLFRTGWHPV